MQMIQTNFESTDRIKDTLECIATIRQAMGRLPKCMQGFLTWLTAQPLQEQVSVHYSSYYQLSTAILSLLVGVALSIFALNTGGEYYIIFCASLLLTVSGMRKLQVVIYHHCSHGTVFKSKLANFLLAEVISIILVVKDFKTYKKDHMAHHNSNKLLTYEDETAQDLGEIGILPGIAKNILWRRMLLSFVSPFAHGRWMLVRIKNCFFSLYPVHNILAICYWAILGYFISNFNLWGSFIIIWLFPLTILYHISRMLRLTAEHRWPNIEIMNSRGKMFTCASTVAVFNGEALPEKTGSHIYDLYQLCCWITRMFSIHLFARVFVLVGDTPCHDYHHRRPSSRDWANYIYARQADKQQGCVGYPVNYSEVWGLFNAIDSNLQSLSECKI